MSIPQGNYHFLVVKADTLTGALSRAQHILAHADYMGKKLLGYEWGNVLNTDVENHGGDRLCDSGEFATIYHIEEYVWERIIPIPWEVKILGDISLIKHTSRQQMLEEDWEAMYQYAHHQREKHYHQETGCFYIEHDSIFREHFDEMGVTNIVNNDPGATKQYVVVLKNLDYCVLA